MQQQNSFAMCVFLVVALIFHQCPGNKRCHNNCDFIQNIVANHYYFRFPIYFLFPLLYQMFSSQEKEKTLKQTSVVYFLTVDLQNQNRNVGGSIKQLKKKVEFGDTSHNDLFLCAMLFSISKLAFRLKQVL